MKIVFEGFYGFKNTGDDAFVEVSNWGAKNYWNSHNNVFLGTDLPNTLTIFNSKQILPEIKGFDRFNVLAHLMNSDFFISSGGSTFQEIPFHSNKSVASFSSNFKRKLKLGAIGVSIGPFSKTTKEKEVISYLKKLDFLAVRDQRSFDLVNSYNLPYQPINAFDLAALLPRIYNQTSEKVKSKKTIIGISVCYYERYVGGNLLKEKKRMEFFEQVIKLLANEKNIYFKVFVFNGNLKFGDYKASEDLMKDVESDKVEFVEYSKDIREIWGEISVCNLMISTRLHAGIFACYAQIPFFLIEYHRKCFDFLTDVGQLENYRFYDAEIDPKNAFLKIMDVLHNGFLKPINLEKTALMAERNFSKTILISP